jgi:hypothetical protein
LPKTLKETKTHATCRGIFGDPRRDVFPERTNGKTARTDGKDLLFYGKMFNVLTAKTLKFISRESVLVGGQMAHNPCGMKMWVGQELSACACDIVRE